MTLLPAIFSVIASIFLISCFSFSMDTHKAGAVPHGGFFHGKAQPMPLDGTF